MAVLSDYTSGTITLANGSTAVTGTGTLFEVTRFREGDTLQIQNLTAVIASVNSDTSLTLTAPWTGTTLTNAIYRARYLPDGARVTAQATTLIELLGSGNLQSIASLTGAADKGLMFTGVGTAGTFDLTAYVRTLLSSTNGSTFYFRLGEVPNGQLPSRLQAINTVDVTNLNDFTGNGWGRYGANTPGAPTPFSGVVFNIVYNGTRIRQYAGSAVNSADFYERTCADGTWSAWVRVLNEANTPITAKGRAIVAKASNDAVLAELLAAPRPSTSGRGLYASFQTSPGVAAVLPAGGTYAYWLVAYDAATGTLRSPIVASIRAGGSTIGAATSGNIWSGVYWNLT